MKYILFTFLALCTLNIALAQQPIATFESKNISRPDITEGTIDTIVYYFTNTGDSPLRLEKPRATCGCTVPSAPRYPIAPGQKDSIVATFDSNHRSGLQAKGINMESNAGEINLIFEVNVIPNTNDNLEPKVPKITPHNHQH